MPYVVATCTKDYAEDMMTEVGHSDEDLSVPIESEETAVQFAMEAIKMLTVLYDLAGEQYTVFPKDHLLLVGTARRTVAFGIKVF